MTTVAIKFIEELKAGKISEAIETIKTGLQESQNKLIEEKRQEVLTSYGFVVSEKKTMKEEDENDDEDDMDDKEDKSEKKDDDDSDSNDDKKDDSDDKDDKED